MKKKVEQKNHLQNNKSFTVAEGNKAELSLWAV
jgi:hypothetical protein